MMDDYGRGSHPLGTDDRRGELLAYATTVAGADDVDTVFEELADAAEHVFNFGSSVVEVDDGDVLTARAWSGQPPTVSGIGADEGIAGHTYQRGETIYVPDVHDHELVEDIPPNAPRSVVSVPIADVGVFQAGLDEPDAFDEEDVELVELLAEHASHAIERIHSQQQLSESEQRFRSLFEEADNAFVLYDTIAGEPGRIQHANQAAESLFGMDVDALREHTLADLLDADSGALVPGGSASTVETELAAPESMRVLDVTAKPFTDSDGADAFAVLRDVTERRQRERVLTSLHDATRRMLVTDDRDEIASVIVEAAKELIDLPYVGVFFAADGELRAATISEPVAGDSSPVLAAGDSIAWDVYERGDPSWIADVQNHPDAHNEDTPIVEEFIVPLGDHGVVLVGAAESGVLSQRDRELVEVLATNGEAALDRSERVRELESQEDERRRERNRLVALFENVPSPTASFVVDDGQPIVQSVNQAFERVFGYSEDELVGENIDDYIVPPEREAEADMYNEKLKAGQNINVEVRRLTVDGPRDFLLDVVPFRLDEPNVQGYAMYTDITDRKERERELERQNDRLEEFASIVSHDLRNPLNVARGYVELAAETKSDEHFERVDDALERMHDIVEDVLTLARHGRSLESTERVSLADAAAESWRHVSTSAATIDVVEDVTLDADPTRLRSLLENLFGNAIQHGSPESGDAVTIEVGALETQGGPGFYVADDGVSIPEDRREAVFESGETFSEDGTGFGLAIVENVAEAHGWSIRLTDSEAGGARFEFRSESSAVVSQRTE
jgi:PAS domain S-box-containing protein